MSAFSDIIDNRHLNLKNEVNDKLTGPESVKFAVGYLYLSMLEIIEEPKRKIGFRIEEPRHKYSVHRKRIS